MEESKRGRGTELAAGALCQLVDKGFLEFAPLPWVWDLISFVEEMYDLHHQEVERELDALRGMWQQGDRPGNEAAEMVTRRLEDKGLAVYTPPPSEEEESPWRTSGPRFYVSVTQAAWQRFPGGAPAPPKALQKLLWPHEADQALSMEGSWPNLVRGLGWALAPPQSSPQALHADIWAEGKPRPGRVRFHHLLWKRQGANCTTQIVPGAFTDGETWEEHYSQMMTASAPCLLVDNEVLHRGAANRSSQWVSTCSIELCTRTGYEEVWKGCSEDDGVYQMLPIRWTA